MTPAAVSTSRAHIGGSNQDPPKGSQSPLEKWLNPDGGGAWGGLGQGWGVSRGRQCHTKGGMSKGREAMWRGTHWPNLGPFEHKI